MPKIKEIISSICILLIVFSLVSCDEKRVFDKYKSIEDMGWLKNTKIAFDFQVSDTLAKYDLFINLRNNNAYEFSNLFLITNMKFPDGKMVIDTLEYQMTDNFGKFLGQGFSEIKENKLLYKEQIAFPLKGEYIISIEQAMRKNGDVNALSALKGITEVGFRIEKVIKK